MELRLLERKLMLGNFHEDREELGGAAPSPCSVVDPFGPLGVRGILGLESLCLVAFTKPCKSCEKGDDISVRYAIANDRRAIAFYSDH